ncbi:hypothetical protein ABTM04_20205, partial [Acinetobacter baumannii]
TQLRLQSIADRLPHRPRLAAAHAPFAERDRQIARAAGGADKPACVAFNGCAVLRLDDIAQVRLMPVASMATMRVEPHPAVGKIILN